MASDRRKRERRQERREERAAPATPAPRREAPMPRSTFGVARAHKQLAETLPSVVRNRSAERQAAKNRRQSPALTLDQGAAKRSPSRPAERHSPAQPKMRDQLKTCKTRPSETKAKGGAGTGRAFVPWC